jgi:hypothetical protein
MRVQRRATIWHRKRCEVLLKQLMSSDSTGAILMSGSRFRKPVRYATSSVTMMTRCIKESASEEAPKHGHLYGCEGQREA